MLDRTKHYFSYPEILRYYTKLKNKDVLLTIFNNTMLIFLLNLLIGNFGILNDITIHIYSVFILIFIMIININFHYLINFFKKNSKIIFFIYLLLFLFIITSLFFYNKELYLIKISFFLISLFLIIKYSGKGLTRDFIIFSNIFFLSQIFIIFFSNIPLFYSFFLTISTSTTNAISSYTNTISLGPLMSGLWMFLTFLFVISVYYIYNKKKDSKYNLLFCRTLIGLFLVWILFIFLQSILFYSSENKILFSQYIFFIINIIIIFPLLTKTKFIDFSFNTPKLNKIISFKKRKKTLVILMVFCLFISICYINIFEINEENEKTIGIYSQGIGIGNMRHPNYNHYGAKGMGFFGLIPNYLKALEYNVKLIDENISNSILNKIDLLIIINPTEIIEAKTLDSIKSFVKEGGSLLVIGDHTDIGGSKKPLNTILKPYGIKYRFDSTIPLKSRWKSSYRLFHHPVNYGIKDSKDISINVGASLNIENNAFPIVISEGGFSDKGNYANNESAFLGNRKYDNGEKFGGLILVAGSYFGKGKIIAFGDSSTFQTLALPYTYQFVDNIVTWLTNDYNLNLELIKIFISSFLMILAFISFYKLFIDNKNIFYFLIILSTLLLGTVTTSTINSFSMHYNDNIRGPICYIDTSKGERFNIEAHYHDSITGFMLNVMRWNDSFNKSYLPIISEDLRYSTISNGRILVIISPTENFKNEEIEDIEKFVINGGLLILCTGYEENNSLESLLNLFGFDISNTPLGPIPYIEENNSMEKYYAPRFVNAFPILINNENNRVEILYSFKFKDKEYPIVVSRKQGKGGILLIADRKFLLEENLESYEKYWPGNIMFLRNIYLKLNKEGILT